jgi:hypothetical protein
MLRRGATQLDECSCDLDVHLPFRPQTVLRSVVSPLCSTCVPFQEFEQAYSDDVSSRMKTIGIDFESPSQVSQTILDGLSHSTQKDDVDEAGHFGSMLRNILALVHEYEAQHPEDEATVEGAALIASWQLLQEITNELKDPTTRVQAVERLKEAVNAKEAPAAPPPPPPPPPPP